MLLRENISGQKIKHFTDLSYFRLKQPTSRRLVGIAVFGYRRQPKVVAIAVFGRFCRKWRSENFRKWRSEEVSEMVQKEVLGIAQRSL